MTFPIDTSKSYKDLVDKLSKKLHNLTDLDEAELKKGLENVLQAYSGKNTLIAGAYNRIAEQFAVKFLEELENGSLIETLNNKNNEKLTFKADLNKSSNKAIEAFSKLPDLIKKFTDFKYVNSSLVVSNVIEHKSLLFKALLDPTIDITQAEINNAITNKNFDGICDKLKSDEYRDLKQALLAVKSVKEDFIDKANEIFLNDKTNFINNIGDLSVSFEKTYSKLNEENKTEFVTNLLSGDLFKTANFSHLTDNDQNQVIQHYITADKTDALRELLATVSFEEIYSKLSETNKTGFITSLLSKDLFETTSFTHLTDNDQNQVIQHYIAGNKTDALKELYQNPDISSTIKQDIIIKSCEANKDSNTDILAKYFLLDPEASETISKIIKQVADNASEHTFSTNMTNIREELQNQNKKQNNPFLNGLIQVIAKQVYPKPAKELSEDEKANLSFNFLSKFLNKSSSLELIKSLNKIQNNSQEPDLSSPTPPTIARREEEEEKEKAAQTKAKELFDRVNKLAGYRNRAKDFAIYGIAALTLLTVAVAFALAAGGGPAVGVLAVTSVLLAVAGFIGFKSFSSHGKYDHKEKMLDSKIAELSADVSIEQKRENLDVLKNLKQEIDKTITKDKDTPQTRISTAYEIMKPIAAIALFASSIFAIGATILFSSALGPVGVAMIATTAATGILASINGMHSSYEKNQYLSNKSTEIADKIGKLDKAVNNSAQGKKIANNVEKENERRSKSSEEYIFRV